MDWTYLLKARNLAKRKRLIPACSRCKAKKLRCSAGRPCSKCVLVPGDGCFQCHGGFDFASSSTPNCCNNDLAWLSQQSDRAWQWEAPLGPGEDIPCMDDEALPPFFAQ